MNSGLDENGPEARLESHAKLSDDKLPAGQAPTIGDVKGQLQEIIGIAKNMREEIATGAREGEKAGEKNA